ncbi:MAG TPA: M56 family metallopeptidase [Puia sp.]|nr:M56 family metallopeptidase [Puia sp.]
MHALFLYSIKLSCSLAALWLFYRLVLRNLTFYNMNRCYLLGYSVLSFLIPLIDIGPALQGDAGGEPLVIQFIPAIGQYAPAITPAPAARASTWSVWTVLLGVMLLGSVFLLTRILFRWIALRQLRRRARLIQGGECDIYQVDEAIAPFSFGKAIYINRSLHTETEWQEIILHEYVHVRQRHTVDILFAEWLTILNWYNPFAWLIRHSIRQNLEFIADRKVLDNGFDKKDYQYHLLKVVGQPEYRLANNFNFSSLKKRIVMMNKLRSARLHLVKFLFILPLVATLLVAFRDGYTGFLRRTGGPLFVNAAGIVIALPGQTPLAGVAVREKSTGLQTTTDANGYYKLKVPVSGQSVRVHLDFTKDGYHDDFRERFIPTLNESLGMIDIETLSSESAAYHGVFLGIPVMHRLPADPTYADAVAALKECLQANEDAQRFLAMQKAHPEVALFYTFEGRHKELVVHTDGSVEKFGFPQGPTIDDLEKKYGRFPAWLKQDDPGAGAGYLARWAAISSQAEKEFHTSNPTARAIIFPGDSRVIAVDATGKARFYDMDNDAPEERPAFERKYGKLPDCVPAGLHYPSMPRHDPRNDTLPVQPRDTLRSVWVRGMHDTLHREQSQSGSRASAVLVAGKDTVPASHPDTLGDKNAIHFNKAANIRLSSWPPRPQPLLIVDGVETDLSGLQKLNPDRIDSISVYKDSTALAKYGSRGRNGVILVYLKKTGPAKP